MPAPYGACRKRRSPLQPVGYPGRPLRGESMERRSRWLLLRVAVALALCLGQPPTARAALEEGDGGATTNPPPQITCPQAFTVGTDRGQCGASVSFSANAAGDPAPSVQYRIGETSITSPHFFP